MINLKIEHSILSCCKRYIEGIEAVYLFGSQITDFFRNESDIDIAVLCLKPISAELRWELSQNLAILLNRDVDLIDLHQASTVMQWQIINTGKQIFCADIKKNAFFETYVLCDYIRLNEQRNLILEDIKKRGSIYG